MQRTVSRQQFLQTLDELVPVAIGCYANLF